MFAAERRRLLKLPERMSRTPHRPASASAPPAAEVVLSPSPLLAEAGSWTSLAPCHHLPKTPTNQDVRCWWIEASGAPHFEQAFLLSGVEKEAEPRRDALELPVHGVEG